MSEEKPESGLHSLSAIISLTNLLEELPLPTHCENSNSKSLLNAEDIMPEDTQCLLNTYDNDDLMNLFSDAMSVTDTNEIELIDGSNSDFIDLIVVPPLLKSILQQREKFKNKIGFAKLFDERHCADWVSRHQNEIECGYNLSDLMNLSPESSKYHQTQDKMEKTFDEINSTLTELHFMSNNGQFVNETSDLSINKNSQNTPNSVLNETQIINLKHEKKKKKKKKPKSEKKHSFDEDENQYSIKKPNSDSQKIVLSLVKVDEQHTKKHKRKRKKHHHQHHHHHHHHRDNSKERSKENKNKRINRSDSNSNNNNNRNLAQQYEPLEKIKLKVIRNGDNAQIISSTIPYKLSPVNNSSNNNNILSSSSVTTTPTTCYSNNSASRNNNAKHNHNQICDISSSSPPLSNKTIMLSAANGYGTPSTNVDHISQYSTSSMPQTSQEQESNNLWINTNNPNNYSLFSKHHHVSDDQFDLSMPIDITGNKTDYLFNDIMSTEDLLSPLNGPNNSHNILLNNVLPENVDSFLLEHFDSTTSTVFDHRGSHREPGGLASYLSNGNKEYDSNNATTPQSNSDIPKQHHHSHHNHHHRRHNNIDSGASNKYRSRQKKRKNELEGLKTWFIGSNTDKKEINMPETTDGIVNQETAWDKTLTNFSYSLSEKLQKRKRNSRQTNKNSAFVFENDEEYSKATTIPPNEDDLDPSKRSSRNIKSGTYIGMDEVDENDDEFGNSRAKRRKKDDDEPFEVKLKDPNEIKYPHLKKSQQENTKKRRERVVELTKLSNTSTKNLVPSDMLDPSLITESTTYQHFLTSIETCLDLIEDVDLVQLLRNETDNENGDNINMEPCELPADALISRDQLQSMCNDIAKLKATGSTKDLPIDKISKLSTLLMFNIRSGTKVCLPSSESESEESQNRLFKELAMERIGRSLDSSFIAMNIMTSSEMPKEVYIEDVIDSVVGCIKYHLNNLVFPEYDPAYRAKNSAKDSQMSIKWKRARERETVKSRSVIYFYNRIVDIISCLSELVIIQSLTDTVVLQLSTIGVSVFFVENVNEVQLVALRLITIIFSKYEKHRELIVKDIFSSLSRLPSSKKNLRNYRLNSEESIQMLTALSLLLVQSVVNVEKIKSLQDNPVSSTTNSNVDSNVEKDSPIQDREVFIENSYNNSLQTAYNFLSVFLQKSTIKGEEDYKNIFDNFVTDLLLTVNKPEWPAAETMLSMLGSLLMKQFTNKNCDQNTRVTCIDYMGNVAATLRRDAVSSTLNDEDIEGVIMDLINGSHSSSEEDDDEEGEDDDEEESELEGDNNSEESDSVIELNSSDEDIGGDGDQKSNKNSHKIKVSKSKKKTPKKKSSKLKAKQQTLKNVDRVQVLRDAILDYLEVDKYDLTSKFARQFYFGQWFSDCSKELKNQNKPKSDSNNNNKTKYSIANSDSTFLQQIDDRKRHLFYKMFGELPSSGVGMTDAKNISNNNANKKLNNKTNRKLTKSKEDNSTSAQLKFIELKGNLDYEDACLACRYLASLKSFSQSFDIYISKICRLLDDNSVAVRTKSMRCLSAVVEADPGILSRKDIEMSVHRRFLDSSTLVREAAVELVGKYLLIRPQLISQYYPMIAERILDKGTSVRKRVIRIFRDICIEHSEFSKIPEICVKMIRRINDEESIKKLVNEVFQNMWFCPVKDRETVKLLQKVMNITDVVSACSSIGYEWFDQLLESLLKRDDNSVANNDKIKLVERACKQIVDCLVQNIMRLEEISQQTNERLVSCLATLYLFTKIRPQLMLQHAVTLQPYLNVRKTSEHDVYIIHYVTRILELTVPLIEHPAEHFISQLEEDMVTLMMTHGKMVLESCVACFSATVNRISHNYSLVKDCFQRLYYNLRSHQTQDKMLPNIKPLISRSLFTVGLLCKHFDFNLLGLHTDINNQVFETLMYYAEDTTLTCDIRTKAISGIGFLCVRHKEILCSTRLSNFYHGVLMNRLTSIHINEYPKIVCCILDNISLFLAEEDKRMRNMDSSWKNNEKKESLKEMGDMLSGIGSRVAQLYLNPILESILQPWTDVRVKAVNLVSLIIRQGLINPITSVPYLIAAQTDPNSSNRVKADNELAEIDKRCVGFVNIKSVQGIKLSCILQEILSLFNKPENHANWFECRNKVSPIFVRGILDPNVDIPLSLNHNLYIMVRSSKQIRRAFLNYLLAIFDDSRSNLSLLIYVCDNLAQFPYQSQEEPLYLVHNIDILVSSLAPNHLHHIKNSLYPDLAKMDISENTVPTPIKKVESIKFDEEEDPQLLYQRVIMNRGSLRVLRDSIRASRGCLLLIALKYYLRELYSLTDAKVQKYAPSDTGKAWERQLTRRSNIKFDPIKSLGLNNEGVSHEEIYQKFLSNNTTVINSLSKNNRNDKGCDGATEDNATSNSSSDQQINLDDELYPNETNILIGKYLHLRHLVLKLDSLDIDGDSDDEVGNKSSTNKTQNNNNTVGVTTAVGCGNEGSSATSLTNVPGTNLTIGFNGSEPISYQSAVAQGLALRVELDKLEPKYINQIINSHTTIRRPNNNSQSQHKKTLVPQMPIASSDEESDEVLKEKHCQLLYGRNKKLSNPRPSRRARQSRPNLSRRKSKSPKESSSDDSFEEEDNVNSDPDFIG